MSIKSGTTSLFDRFRKRARELRSANGANVTIIFALAVVPMVGFVGAAVDYSHANSVKAAMQAAADGTALMLSKQASTLNQSDIQPKADAYFKALFNRPEATGLQVTATYTTSGGNKIVVGATANMKMNFMGLMGLTQPLKVGVDSMAKWGNSKLRVALALDTTGSMQSDGKIDALKTATKALLDQLKAAAANDGDVYVSIIPFSKDVNVGKANFQATWLNWEEWDEDNGDDVSSTKCTKKGKKTKCSTSTNWVPDNHNTWNGCVTDRGGKSSPGTGDYDTKATAPTANTVNTLFVPEQYDNCSPPIKALSYDWIGMKTLVDSFYPSGMTNQGIGLVHAWMSLVGGGPYPTPPAEDPNYKYNKIIILMSDGLNTENRWYDSGGWFNNGAHQIDDRQKLTCANVKAAGITLYTIHVNTDGDPLSTLLQGCASAPDKFWMLTNASQLVSTFKQIGTNLSNLRLAE